MSRSELRYLPGMRALALLPAFTLAACASLHTRPEDRRPLLLPAETLDGAPVTIGGPGPIRVVEVWATW